MIGADAIVRMRRAGYRPAGWVTVWVDEAFPPAEVELVILPMESVERLDLRCLKGLRVNVLAMREASAARLDAVVHGIETVGVASLIVHRNWLAPDHPNFLTVSTQEAA